VARGIRPLEAHPPTLAMSARANSPPAATRPAPKPRSGARHPPLGGAGGDHNAMSARAKSPPAATRPAPKARSGARHPPPGGGAGATRPAD